MVTAPPPKGRCSRESTRAGSYRNQWWSTGDDRGTFYATGIHGQFLWLDPTSDVTIVKFSSLPVAVTEQTSRRHAETFSALTRALA